jgi:hypothetical protein
MVIITPTLDGLRTFRTQEAPMAITQAVNFLNAVVSMAPVGAIAIDTRGNVTRGGAVVAFVQALLARTDMGIYLDVRSSSFQEGTDGSVYLIPVTAFYSGREFFAATEALKADLDLVDSAEAARCRLQEYSLPVIRGGAVPQTFWL